MGKLEGRTALVTGSSRGIGKAVALALAEAGCNLVVNYVREHDAAHRVAAKIREMGRVCKVQKADVSSPTEIEQLVGEAESLFGAVDILVNNAGIAQSKPVQDVTLSDWERVLRVNLTSAFLLIQRVLVNMRPRRWGRIINLILSRGAERRRYRPALRRFQSRHDRPHSFVRFVAGERRDYRKRYCSSSYQDRHGYQQSPCIAAKHPDGHFRRTGGDWPCRPAPGGKRLHYGPDLQCEWRLVYDLVDRVVCSPSVINFIKER